MSCFEGRANKFKSDLRALRERSSQPDPLQAAACLAAQKKHLKILEVCIKEGAVFDRYLNRAAQLGTRGDTAFLEFLLAWNWENIQHSSDAVQDQIKHSGDDSIEAEWLKKHAGKGSGPEELGTFSPGMANNDGENERRKQPKNSANRDPKQGYSPEQIREAFGDIPW